MFYKNFITIKFFWLDIALILNKFIRNEQDFGDTLITKRKCNLPNKHLIPSSQQSHGKLTTQLSLKHRLGQCLLRKIMFSFIWCV